MKPIVQPTNQVCIKCRVFKLIYTELTVKKKYLTLWMKKKGGGGEKMLQIKSKTRCNENKL